MRPICPSCGYVFGYDASEGQLYRCPGCREFFRVAQNADVRQAIAQESRGEDVSEDEPDTGKVSLEQATPDNGGQGTRRAATDPIVPQDSNRRGTDRSRKEVVSILPIVMVALCVVGGAFAASMMIVFTSKAKRVSDKMAFGHQGNSNSPLDGTWYVAERVLAGVFYTFETHGRKGVLTVEHLGKIVRRHSFTTRGQYAISLTNAKNGPYSQKLFTAEAILDIFLLRDPPRELTFSKEPPKQTKTDTSGKYLFVSGLFDMPVPFPIRKIELDERFPLPFVVDYDWRLEFGPASSRILEDGDWVTQSIRGTVFENPIHPRGYVKKLGVQDLEIRLLKNEIDNGILHTADLGDFELLSYGPGRGQTIVMVTCGQVRKIAERLSERGEESDKNTQLLKAQ